MCKIVIIKLSNLTTNNIKAKFIYNFLCNMRLQGVLNVLNKKQLFAINEYREIFA
jgi:hypothetical protein